MEFAILKKKIPPRFNRLGRLGPTETEPFWENVQTVAKPNRNRTETQPFQPVFGWTVESPRSVGTVYNSIENLFCIYQLYY